MDHFPSGAPIYWVARDSKRVAIVDETGRTVFSYSCSRFRAQVQTQEEAVALWHEMRRIDADARARDEFVFLQELRASFRGRKIRETERLVVDYKCRHNLD